jgi:hypothetical protein
MKDCLPEATTMDSSRWSKKVQPHVEKVRELIDSLKKTPVEARG